jgi:hypothetical protein
MAIQVCPTCSTQFIDGVHYWSGTMTWKKRFNNLEALEKEHDLNITQKTIRVEQ